MSNELICKTLLFATFCFPFLSSCENEDSSIVVDEETYNIDFIQPKGENDSTALFINTFNDLRKTLTQVADERELALLSSGWLKVKEDPLTRAALKSKRLVRTDTVYVYHATGDDYSDPSIYANFNARFSKTMVDSINREVSSEYRISANKTYVCRWRLFNVYYNAQEGEQVASRPSPLCALVPTTKSFYTDRGYSLYIRGNQYQMNSYQLRIQWENVSHKTIILDIDWPFFPKNPSGLGYMGYQFIYAVSKRI